VSSRLQFASAPVIKPLVTCGVVQKEWFPTIAIRTFAGQGSLLVVEGPTIIGVGWDWI